MKKLNEALAKYSALMQNSFALQVIALQGDDYAKKQFDILNTVYLREIEDAKKKGSYSAVEQEMKNKYNKIFDYLVEELCGGKEWENAANYLYSLTNEGKKEPLSLTLNNNNVQPNVATPASDEGRKEVAFKDEIAAMQLFLLSQKGNAVGAQEAFASISENNNVQPNVATPATEEDRKDEALEDAAAAAHLFGLSQEVATARAQGEFAPSLNDDNVQPNAPAADDYDTIIDQMSGALDALTVCLENGPFPRMDHVAALAAALGVTLSFEKSCDF